MLKFKKMGSEKIPMLLVTANVGSIFESPTAMLPLWVCEFLQTITKMEPKFIGLHMQEVGGKTYEKSMQYVQDFVRTLCDSAELKLFDKIRIYLDEDYSSAEKFTALGNIYFIHSTLTDVKIWDFISQEWHLVEGKEIHSGNIEKVTSKEKAKFPQHFFPECKWSRKGFMRVRWLVKGTAFELINVHLFHDASNMLAAESTPSVYCRSRRRALRHTLQHLHQDSKQPPFFIFGDFNFRLDTAGVVKKLSDNLKTNRIYNGKSVEHTKCQYRDIKDEKVVMTVGKKEFVHAEHQKIFREPWVLKFDKELEALKPHLYEFPIKFPPTYPFEENIDLPTHYMKTRCPSWCDRILLSQTARLIINHLDGQKLMPRDPAESRRSIVEQMDGVLKHGSRRSIAESTDSGGGSPSKGSHRSSGQSSSESSPARSASPNKYGVPSQSHSPVRKPGCVEFDGLTVPGITQSRKSIADPTNIVHAMNARANDTSNGSPSKRRLVRNQSEGSPKMGEHIDLRKISTDANTSTRKRIEYGIIGENTCMGDHKPVYLRLLLQSDKGTVRCCTQADSDNYCYRTPPEIQSESCFRHPSVHNLFKCPSRECFEPLSVTYSRSRLASQISCDSGFKGLSPKEKPPSLIRLSTDPSLVVPSKPQQEHLNNSQPVLPVDENETIEPINSMIIPNVQITGADYVSYDGIIVNNIDTHLLYTENVPAYPYTPESIESRSPYPGGSNESLSSDKESIDVPKDAIDVDAFENLVDTVSELNEVDFYHRKRHQSLDRTDVLINKSVSVSPTQLKSRLESILNSSTIDLDGSEDSTEVDATPPPPPPVNSNHIPNTSKDQCSNDVTKKKSSGKSCNCLGCIMC